MKLIGLLSLAAVAVVSAAPKTEDFYVREEIPLPPGEVIEGASIAVIDDNKVAQHIASRHRHRKLARQETSQTIRLKRHDVHRTRTGRRRDFRLGAQADDAASGRIRGRERIDLGHCAGAVAKHDH